MKTLSRTIMEKEWRDVCTVAPIVPTILSFTDCLTRDKEYVSSRLDLLYKDGAGLDRNMFDNRGMDINSRSTRAYIQQNIMAINQYGHGLVMQLDTKRPFDMKSIEECMEVLSKIDTMLAVNGKEVCAIQWPGKCVVKYKGKSIECKYMSAYSNAIQLACFVSMDGNHIFTTDDNPFCDKCPSRKARCRVPAKTGAIVYTLAYDGSDYTVDAKPHKIASECRATNMGTSIVRTLFAGFKVYEETFIRERCSAAECKARGINRESTETEVEDEGAYVLVDEDGEEKRIKMCQYMHSEKCEWLGGHHASPKVHNVSGYYRRRSRNDSTLIWIDGFPRGGTKKQREEIGKNKVTRQIVYTE